MRVLLVGRIGAADLTAAAMLFDIEPTSFVTDGTYKPPTDLPTQVVKPDPMVGDGATRQKNWRLCLYSDAAIVRGASEHLREVLDKTADYPIYFAEVA